MNDLFKLKEHGTDVQTEITAGITTFLTMSYIIVVNPAILADAGIPAGPGMAATILAAVAGCLDDGVSRKPAIRHRAVYGRKRFHSVHRCAGHGRVLAGRPDRCADRWHPVRS